MEASEKRSALLEILLCRRYDAASCCRSPRGGRAGHSPSAHHCSGSVSGAAGVWPPWPRPLLCSRSLRSALLSVLEGTQGVMLCGSLSVREGIQGVMLRGKHVPTPSIQNKLTFLHQLAAAPCIAVGPRDHSETTSRGWPPSPIRQRPTAHGRRTCSLRRGATSPCSCRGPRARGLATANQSTSTPLLGEQSLVLLQVCEGSVDLRGPENLSSSQSHLGRVEK